MDHVTAAFTAAIVYLLVWQIQQPTKRDYYVLFNIVMDSGVRRVGNGGVTITGKVNIDSLRVHLAKTSSEGGYGEVTAKQIEIVTLTKL